MLNEQEKAEVCDEEEKKVFEGILARVKGMIEAKLSE